MLWSITYSILPPHYNLDRTLPSKYFFLFPLTFDIYLFLIFYTIKSSSISYKIFHLYSLTP